MTKGKPEFTERIKELLAQGFSYNEIEARLGVSKGTISGLVWRINHPKREPYLGKPKAKEKRSELPDRMYHPSWEEEK